MDNLFEQISTIQKASAYEIVSKQATKLQEENKVLRREKQEALNEVKRLKGIIDEYYHKTLNNLNRQPGEL